MKPTRNIEELRNDPSFKTNMKLHTLLLTSSMLFYSIGSGINNTINYYKGFENYLNRQIEDIKENSSLNNKDKNYYFKNGVVIKYKAKPSD